MLSFAEVESEPHNTERAAFYRDDVGIFLRPLRGSRVPRQRLPRRRERSVPTPKLFFVTGAVLRLGVSRRYSPNQPVGRRKTSWKSTTRSRSSPAEPPDLGLATTRALLDKGALVVILDPDFQRRRGRQRTR